MFHVSIADSLKSLQCKLYIKENGQLSVGSIIHRHEKKDLLYLIVSWEVVNYSAEVSSFKWLSISIAL